MDARKLSNLLRGGFLISVYHDGSKREQFRSLMSGYQDLIEEGVRLKNRYKSFPRFHEDVISEKWGESER